MGIGGLVDLLCSRNARPQNGETGSLVVLLLAERARHECARSTRALADQPGRPAKRYKRELGKVYVGRAQWEIKQAPLS